MAETRARVANRNWNLPNMLTYGRLAAVPVVVGFLFWPADAWARWTALAIYSAAAITDFFDGYLARAWSQQSSLGRMAGASLWAAIVILCREILVSGLREYLAELRVSVPVTAVAKWKTTAQLISLGFLIAGPAGEAILPSSIEIGIVLLWVAASLTLYTGWDYMKASYDHVGGD
jgi:CDP-diacylglycerol--glycerol-3-phosphate 3-phosphatidyltransferase/cardiolipin synthase